MVAEGASAREPGRRASLSQKDRPQKRRTSQPEGPQPSEDSKVLVAVRVRPLTKTESDETAGEADARVMDKRFVVVAHRPGDMHDPLRGNRVREKRYAFDYAFDVGTSQTEIYNLTTRSLVDGVLEGFNATVFAYGATGAGKTYTMIGETHNPGIMVLTLQDLFERIQDSKRAEYEFKVTFNYLEVYNENIRDLLSPESVYLDLREDPVKGMCVAGISDWEVTSASEIMELLRRGNRHRTQEPTAANAYSSRSHAVLQVTVQRSERIPDTSTPVRVAKLSLIDLAGSERAAKTKNQGIRMIEGANINRSLLALGNCINALGDRAVGGKGAYVPFRDSKLTRLLKDSLGGNCRTTMIANISPARHCLEESLNTLKYANRAKNIQLKVQANVTSIDSHIAEYAQIIADLRTEISRLKVALATAATDSSSPALNNAQEEETKLLDNLRNNIMQNFEDRTQIQRSLLDLEELQIQNAAEVGRLERAVVRWEESHPGASDAEVPKEVRSKRQEMLHIQANTERNSELKAVLVERLEECDEAAKEQRAAFPKLLAAADRRSLLEMEFRMRLLEMHNIELEEHTIMRDNLMKERATVLSDLKSQLALRDRIISRQRQLLLDASRTIPEDLEADYSAYDSEQERPQDIVESMAAPTGLKLPEIVTHHQQARRAPRTRTATTRNAAVVAERRLANHVYSTTPPQRAVAVHMDMDEETEPVVVAAFPPAKKRSSTALANLQPLPVKNGVGLPKKGTWTETSPTQSSELSTNAILPSLDPRTSPVPGTSTPTEARLARMRAPSAGSVGSDRDTPLKRRTSYVNETHLDNLKGRVPFRGRVDSARKPPARAVKSAVPPGRGQRETLAQERERLAAARRRSARNKGDDKLPPVRREASGKDDLGRPVSSPTKSRTRQACKEPASTRGVGRSPSHGATSTSSNAPALPPSAQKSKDDTFSAKAPEISHPSTSAGPMPPTKVNTEMKAGLRELQKVYGRKRVGSTRAKEKPSAAETENNASNANSNIRPPSNQGQIQQEQTSNVESAKVNDASNSSM